MNKPTLPSLFLSHGSPMTALEPREAGAFMQSLGPAIDAQFGRPRAILVVSAHTTAAEITLLVGDQHHAVYDFGGFSPELYTLRYDAPGAPALAQEVAELLTQAGIHSHTLPQGGLDHGIWTPLRYMYPQADVPVLPLAFVPTQSPTQQFALGAALSSLSRSGVLVIGSGSVTHNLRMVFDGAGRSPVDKPEIPECSAFRDWVKNRSLACDWDALLNYRRQAPHAALMHPTDEHWLPWYVAAGAGGPEHAPQRLHASVTFGCLGMDAYAFGPEARRLLTS